MVNIPAGRLQVATPATMALAIRGLTEATDAVDERVAPVVSEVLGDNPDVIAAAVALAQSDAGLVREAPESVDGPYARVAIDPGRWIAEPDAIDRDGKTPPWVLRNWAARIHQALLGVVCFGDSMFADFGNLGTSTPVELAKLIGVPVVGRGVTSQSITEIGLRQGGVNLLLTLAGNTLPSSGPVSVTVSLAGTWRAEAWTFTGAVYVPTLGLVPGVLQKTANTQQWSFIRSVDGSAVAVPAGALFVSDQSPTPLVGQIIRGGRNSPDVAIAKRDIRAMITHARGKNAPLLVLPVYNNATEPKGSMDYNTIMSINENHQDAAGTDWLDTRRMLIDSGLAEMGITPTAQDLTDIGNDQIPSSLMHDVTHLNVNGRIAEARFLARFTSAKGWY